MTFRMDILHLLCRICGEESKNCVSVFGESGIKQKIAQKIRHCLPLIIDETDTMPKQICLMCLTKVEQVWELYQLCKKSQISIAEKLARLHVNEISNFSITSIEEKLKKLSHMNPIVVGESAVITLAPATPPPPPIPTNTAMSPITPILSEGQVTSSDTLVRVMAGQSLLVNTTPVTYLTTSPAGTMEPQMAQLPVSTPVIENGVYPQGLIQVNPSSKPVMYTERPANKRPAPAQKQTVPAPKRSVPLPKPMPSPSTPRRELSISVPVRKRGHKMCKYCNKSFPNDIINHHVNLHLKQSFFTCLDCNKNFHTETAMARHKCGVEDPIDLDADDELICL